MGHARLIVVLTLSAGCGRFGFEQVPAPDGATTAPPMADATLPSMLTCGQPARASLPAAAALAAIGTTRGIAIVTSTAGAVGGWAFDVTTDGALAAGAQDVALGTSPTNQVGVATSGATILVSASEGMPPTGTTLAPFDLAFAPSGSPSHRMGELAVSGPLAASGASFAYVTQDATTRVVDARHVDPGGADASLPVPIVLGGAKASEPVIIATPHGHALAYVAAATSPNEARLELLDASFNVVAGPVVASNSGFGPAHVKVSHATASDTYLVTWMEKNATTDTVWIALFAGDLSVIKAGTQIAVASYRPTVATDGTGFWVVWQNGSAVPAFLAGAHVSPTGAVAPRQVQMSGGKATQWTMVERFNQPMLVWLETGGSAPNLSVDPMCP